jgi:non-ribosomal peptide synthetase component F
LAVVSIACFKQAPGQSLARQGHDQGAGRPHRATFGRRGDAEKDRAEDEEDQEQGWQQRRQRAQQQLAAVQRSCFGGQGRRPARLEHRHQ